MGTPLPKPLPIVVLVPGAWHSPAHYALLIQMVENAGYTVVTAALPSLNSHDPANQSVARDSAYIRVALLEPQIDAGKEVLLVMHSYGGCPGAAAAKGLSVVERKERGEEGGVVGMVFLAAFVAGEGDSLKGKLPGGVYDSWVVENTQTKQLIVDNPQAVFYHDVEPELAQKVILELKTQAEPSLSSPSPSPAWPDKGFDGRRAYIQALQDRAIPFVAQDAMVKYSGVGWEVRQLDTSHSPFLSKPEELGDVVLELFRMFGGLEV
ncbi:alpha/beta-hydrolase [Patellaria atrata CBS 101060]|uniref:Alpha/beta-hydrolase n=1 Tax=Patellaria atrata CBS 101060 TaxID=1346257 RepID=A0A9P4SI35_9PEZI|nr:alpha/beta-hydrolase [Patellaria atrata CBS 101060]